MTTKSLSPPSHMVIISFSVWPRFKFKGAKHFYFFLFFWLFSLEVRNRQAKQAISWAMWGNPKEGTQNFSISYFSWHIEILQVTYFLTLCGTSKDIKKLIPSGLLWFGQSEHMKVFTGFCEVCFAAIWTHFHQHLSG